MPDELSTKAVLFQAIQHLERLYYGRSGAAIWALPPHVQMALAITLASAVEHRRPTCLLSETLPPQEAALHLVSLRSRTSLDKIASQRVEDVDFARLTVAVGQISSSPLVFARFPCADAEQIAESFLALARNREVEVVVAERRTTESLSAWEERLQFFSRVEGVEVLLLAGRPAAYRGRFSTGSGQRF